MALTRRPVQRCVPERTDFFTLQLEQFTLYGVGSRLPRRHRGIFLVSNSVQNSSQRLLSSGSQVGTQLDEFKILFSSPGAVLPFDPSQVIDYFYVDEEGNRKFPSSGFFMSVLNNGFFDLTFFSGTDFITRNGNFWFIDPNFPAFVILIAPSSAVNVPTAGLLPVLNTNNNETVTWILPLPAGVSAQNLVGYYLQSSQSFNYGGYWFKIAINTTEILMIFQVLPGINPLIITNLVNGFFQYTFNNSLFPNLTLRYA